MIAANICCKNAQVAAAKKRIRNKCSQIRIELKLMRLRECRMPKKVFMIFELEMLFCGLGSVVNYDPMVQLFLHGAVVVVEWSSA